MAYGVLLHRADSIYNDQPERQYQFPKQYLGRASQFIGDWIVYYEPGKHSSARRYFAIARIEKIVPDPTADGMYLAMIEPGSYLPFEHLVPFSGSDGLVEQGVLNEAGRISGRAQAAVRPISPEDFNRIIERGFPDEPMLPRADLAGMEVGSMLADDRVEFLLDAERQRVAYLSSRIVRDRVFRKVVLDAYDCRCAVSGLKFINGGGRAEVEAAHIKPVERDGPDSIRNGLALSGTAHWMFDRGLISLSDELDVLVSRQVNDVDNVWKFVNPTRRAIVPGREALRPHPNYLAWHRDNCFKL